MSDFKTWFTGQDFYTNMRFIHGDALFAKDGDVYRVLPVQIAYQAWQTARYKTKDEHLALTQEWHRKGWDDRQEEIDQLKAENKRLSGLLKEQKRCFDECSQMTSDLLKERDQIKAEKEGLEKKLKEKSIESTNWLIRASEEQVEKEALEKRIYSALMLLQRNQLYIPALAMEQIGKVLRGGHE